MSAADEAALRRSWPLLPPLGVLYHGGGRAETDFTAWRCVPRSIRVVSVPLRLPVRDSLEITIALHPPTTNGPRPTSTCTALPLAPGQFDG